MIVLVALSLQYAAFHSQPQTTTTNNKHYLLAKAYECLGMAETAEPESTFRQFFSPSIKIPKNHAVVVSVIASMYYHIVSQILGKGHKFHPLLPGFLLIHFLLKPFVTYILFPMSHLFTFVTFAVFRKTFSTKVLPFATYLALAFQLDILSLLPLSSLIGWYCVNVLFFSWGYFSSHLLFLVVIGVR